ncbi:MAG: hypothetical protein FJX76_13130 [Armatimonadetes bacterium]|nr:hypothetical protein [Armatimonadota bacterium]
MSPSPRRKEMPAPRPGLLPAGRRMTLRVSGKERVARRRLEQQRMATESWRDMLGIAVVTAIVCSIACAALMGPRNPLTVAVMLASLGACVALSIPTWLHFRRWHVLRQRLRAKT